MPVLLQPSSYFRVWDQYWGSLPHIFEFGVNTEDHYPEATNLVHILGLEPGSLAWNTRDGSHLNPTSVQCHALKLIGIIWTENRFCPIYSYLRYNEVAKMRKLPSRHFKEYLQRHHWINIIFHIYSGGGDLMILQRGIPLLSSIIGDYVQHEASVQHHHFPSPHYHGMLRNSGKGIQTSFTTKSLVWSYQSRS